MSERVRVFFGFIWLLIMGCTNNMQAKDLISKGKGLRQNRKSVGFFTDANGKGLVNSGKSCGFSVPSVGIVVGTPINKRWDISTGVSFSPLNSQNNVHHADVKSNILGGGQKLNSFKIPLKVEYYFASPGTRVRPFLGVDVEMQEGNDRLSGQQMSGDNYRFGAGAKFITVLLDQGFTYEINTKIQVKETMHFLNLDGSKSLGISVGISFYLP